MSPISSRVRAAGRRGRRLARAAMRRTAGDTVMSTSPFDRRALLLEGVTREMRVLEIGPSYAPLAPRAEGWDVCIVDHATREQLVEKYADPVHGVDVARIEEVDVVWQDGTLDACVPSELHGFDVCLASHVIEHTPDLVGFVQGVMHTLAPGGWLSLAVPDMRYCFDLLRAPTQVGALVEACATGASRHRLAALYDHHAYAVRQDGRTAWGQGDVGALELLASFEPAADLVASHREGLAGEYLDCHAWQFTPASFELAILELAALGLLDVHPAALHDSVGCEFFVTLRPGRRLPASTQELDALRLSLLERAARELATAWAGVGR